jgi:hypothetical protein
MEATRQRTSYARASKVEPRNTLRSRGKDTLLASRCIRTTILRKRQVERAQNLQHAGGRLAEDIPVNEALGTPNCPAFYASIIGSNEKEI